MQLDNVAAVLRPRNHWEAIDLGFAMTRRWLMPIYGTWFAVLLPLAVIIHLLCGERFWLALLIIWWLKPLLDRIPLHILSQAMFGAPPGIWQTLQALPRLLTRGALVTLTLLRLQAARSFYLPVRQLEDLRGKPRRDRQRMLAKRNLSPAVWLTLTCIHLEIAADAALIGLAWLLFPDFILFDLDAWLEDSPQLRQLLLNAVLLLGLSLIEPCYVAAGFALYLNRRTALEAWDLEIGLRRLAQRLPAPKPGSTIALIAMLALSATPGAVQPAWAKTDATAPRPAVCEQLEQQRLRLEQSTDTIKQTLAEVLREDAFSRCQLKRVWRIADDGDREMPELIAEEPFFSVFLARIIEAVLWIMLVVLAAAGAWWWLDSGKHWRRDTTPPAPAPPLILHGSPIRPEDFPEDVGAAAWRLWRTGHARAALSLLYRASLAALMTQHGVRFGASATEEECLRCAAAGQLQEELLVFTERLTSAWQAIAYAHRPPPAAEVRELCGLWSRFFQRVAQEPPG